MNRINLGDYITANLLTEEVTIQGILVDWTKEFATLLHRNTFVKVSLLKLQKVEDWNLCDESTYQDVLRQREILKHNNYELKQNLPIEGLIND